MVKSKAGGGGKHTRGLACEQLAPRQFGSAWQPSRQVHREKRQI